MYKFTIFTIIFSVITVVVVLNLIITDFRPERPFSVEQNLSPSPSPSGKVKFSINSDPGPLDSESKTSFSPEFWRKSGLEPETVISKVYKENIFAILSPTNSGVLAVRKFFISAGDLTGVEIYEIQLADKESALRQYEDFANTGRNSILYSINATDSYGDRSFFLNDEIKPDLVFLIISRGNVIYAFAYPKEKHDRMISIYNNLQ